MICFMITITGRGRVKAFSKLYAEHGADVGFICYGHGTASSDILDAFGLDDSEKAVMFSCINDRTFIPIKRELQSRFHIDVPGTGVVFTVPLSAVGGKKQLSFLLGEQEYVRSEESVMKNTENELIIVIANQGYTEMIMDAARSAGVRGGTVLHAKGTGMQWAEKFFGFVLADEKEMIYMVIKSSMREQIMRAIMDQTGIRSKAQAICFSLPVSATAGLRLAEPEQEKNE